MDETDSPKGLLGSDEAKWANTSFHLLTLRENSAEGIPFQDFFMVINQPIAETHVINNQQIQSIEGRIGSPFMAMQGWTLDFAQRVIISVKV